MDNCVLYRHKDSSKVMIINKIIGAPGKDALKVVDEYTLAKFFIKLGYNDSDYKEAFEPIARALTDKKDYSNIDIQAAEHVTINLRVQEMCDDPEFIRTCLSTWFPNLPKNIVDKYANDIIDDPDYILVNTGMDEDELDDYDSECEDDTFDLDYDHVLTYNGGIWLSVPSCGKYAPIFSLFDFCFKHNDSRTTLVDCSEMTDEDEEMLKIQEDIAKQDLNKQQKSDTTNKKVVTHDNVKISICFNVSLPQEIMQSMNVGYSKKL